LVTRTLTRDLFAVANLLVTDIHRNNADADVVTKCALCNCYNCAATAIRSPCDLRASCVSCGEGRSYSITLIGNDTEDTKCYPFSLP